MRELIAESVGALDGERGLFDRILMGKIKVGDDLVSVGKFREILLENMRSKKMRQVIERDDRADSAFESEKSPISATRKVLAVLNTQLYQTGERIWLAQQLVDMRTIRIVWSGIYARPLSNSTQNPEEDTSLTIGS